MTGKENSEKEALQTIAKLSREIHSSMQTVGLKCMDVRAMFLRPEEADTFIAIMEVLTAVGNRADTILGEEYADEKKKSRGSSE